MVAPDIVLSAAHCGKGWDSKIFIGIHDLNDFRNVEKFKVEDLVDHPLYDDYTYEFDVRLLKIRGRDKNMTSWVDPVRINSDADFPMEGESLTVIGWGANDLTFSSSGVVVSSTNPNITQEVELNYIGNERCDELFRPYVGVNTTSDMMCAGDQEGKSSCFGDSGGPLFVWDDVVSQIVQVGISSWGLTGFSKDCSGETPTVFHRISYGFEWIRTTICELSNDPPPYLECSTTTTPPRDPPHTNKEEEEEHPTTNTTTTETSVSDLEGIDLIPVEDKLLPSSSDSMPDIRIDSLLLGVSVMATLYFTFLLPIM